MSAPTPPSRGESSQAIQWQSSQYSSSPMVYQSMMGTPSQFHPPGTYPVEPYHTIADTQAHPTHSLPAPGGNFSAVGFGHGYPDTMMPRTVPAPTYQEPSSAEAGLKAKRKRKRTSSKEDDDPRPKKPMNCFIVYRNLMKDCIKKGECNGSNGEETPWNSINGNLSKKISAMWHHLSEDDETRRHCVAVAKEDKARFDRELSEWKARISSRASIQGSMQGQTGSQFMQPSSVTGYMPSPVLSEATEFQPGAPPHTIHTYSGYQQPGMAWPPIYPHQPFDYQYGVWPTGSGVSTMPYTYPNQPVYHPSMTDSSKHHAAPGIPGVVENEFALAFVNDDASRNEASGNDAPGNDALGINASVNDASVDEAIANDTSGTDGFSVDAFFPDAFGDAASRNEASGNDAPVNDALGINASVNDASVDEAIANDTSGTDGFSVDAFFTDAFGDAASRNEAPGIGASDIDALGDEASNIEASGNLFDSLQPL
ncbi:hypothetical protein F4780DRAFT_780658 [Xylariomycetidae sp. FL0641]|nr:hypothetical protein F4780DRAFT_780658 [Xylariomycetidae sp. FL0641]